MRFRFLCIVLAGMAGYGLASGSARAASPIENALPPIGHTIFCRDYPDDCSSRGASSLFALLSEGTLYENLAMVNRWINSVIIPDRFNDVQSVASKWSVLPVVGTCHDFAVSKRHALLKMGWPSSALLLAEVALKTGEHHLVLVADIRGKRFVLDNLNPAPVPMHEAKEYSWIRMQSARDVGYWMKANSM